jgi:hypothetical protein
VSGMCERRIGLSSETSEHVCVCVCVRARARGKVGRREGEDSPNMATARKVLPGEPCELVWHKPRAVDDVGSCCANFVGDLQCLLLALVGARVDTRANQRVGSAPSHVRKHIPARETIGGNKWVSACVGASGSGIQHD